MLILDNHVVTIRCPAHGLDLHVYFGRARPPDTPFHVKDRDLERMFRITHDPQRLIDMMTTEVDDALFT